MLDLFGYTYFCFKYHIYKVLSPSQAQNDVFFQKHHKMHLKYTYSVLYIFHTLGFHGFPSAKRCIFFSQGRICFVFLQRFYYLCIE